MKIIPLVLTLLLASNYVLAQETESSKELGIEFTYPSNWTLTVKLDGYLLGSEKLEGFILIRVESYKSLKKMKVSMQNGIKNNDGTLLTPTTDLQPYGENALASMYEGNVDEQKVRGFLIGKFDNATKKSAIIIVVAPETRFNQSHMDALKMIGRSLKFL